MKRKLITIVSLIMVFTLLIGCGNKENNTNNNYNKKPNNNINNETKVNNLSESFLKYSEIKSKKMTELTKLTEKSDNPFVAMALIPIGMSDLAAIPASVCGLNESDAVRQLFLFTNISYKTDGDKCTITYSDQRGVTSKFVAMYDSKTDSVTMEAYENNVHILTSEYIKIKDGYATQFFSIEDADDKITVYKTLFENNNIYTSIFEDVSKPESIFKKTDLTADFAKNGNYLYIEIVNGIANGTLEGETLNFESSTNE